MKTNSRDWAVLALTFSACLLLIAGCGDKGSANNDPSSPERKVIVVQACKGNLAETLHLTGTLKAMQEIKITSKIPGRVKYVPVDEGSSVKEGDILIELEQKELALAVKQAEAALATAQAGLSKVMAGTRKEKIDQARALLAQARANVEICRITFERMRNLLKHKSIPRTRYDEAKAHYDAAQAQCNSAQAQLEMAKSGATREDIELAGTRVEQAGAALASAGRQLQNTIISSPIDGIVAEKNVEPGEVVSPPMMPGKALLNIMDVKALKAMVNISENRVKTVILGQEAIITLDGFPGEIFPGKVSKISPIVDPRSRTYKAEVLISNSENRLKPGMFARVQLVLTRRADVVKVPIKAVIEAEDGKIIFLSIKGKAKAQDVTLGIADGVYAEVISGVNAGDKIIVEGNLGLEDGDRIAVKGFREKQTSK